MPRDDGLGLDIQGPVSMFGVYVQSLSIQLGLGGQGGTLQAKLVEDEANNVLLEKDADGNPFYGGSMFSPTTGTACYFKYGNFYFGGIFQRWSFSESVSGGRTYDIVLESASKLMDGVQIILEKYNGTTDAFANQFNNNDFSTNLYENFGNTPSFAQTYNDIKNVFNVFGAYENPDFGVNNLADIPIPNLETNNPNFPAMNPTEYQNFGASGFNSSGMPIDKILIAMEHLMKEETNHPFGGPIQFGVSEDDILALQPGTLYDFNLRDLATFFEEESIDFTTVRLKGPVKSVNTIISEMGELFQYDFYYNTQHRNLANILQNLPDGGSRIPNLDEDYSTESFEDLLALPKPSGDTPRITLRTENATGTGAEIRLKVTSKREAPERNAVRQFITDELELPENERTLMSYSLGKEFADTTTQKVIWGGRRTRYLKIGQTFGPQPNDNRFGRYNANNAISEQFVVWGRQPSFNGRRPYNTVGTVGQVYGAPLQRRTIYIENVGPYLASPFEIRMALGGKEGWQVFKTLETIAGLNEYNIFNMPWQSGTDLTPQIIASIAGGQAGNAFDMMTTNLQRASSQWAEQQKALADAIFSGVSAIGSQSFGKEFLLKLPNEIYGPSYGPSQPIPPNYNLYEPAEEFELLKSWETADSAFDSVPLTFDIANWDAVGRVTSLAGWVSRGDCDYSALGSDFALGANFAAGMLVSKKGSPEKESYFDNTGLFGGGFLNMFDAGAQIKLFDAITTPDFGLTVLANVFFGATLPPASYIGSGKQSLQFAIPPDLLLPAVMGVPQESGRLSYGPWVTIAPQFGGYFKPWGKAEALEDESLRPETFGSFAALQTIGGISAQVAETNLFEAETGQVELAGAPAYNVGERFATQGPYVSSMSINIDATAGVKTTYKFNTWTPQFGKIAKYNIDRIAKITQNRFSFAKKKRDEVEQRPFPARKFEKTDFSKLTNAQRGQDNSSLQMLFGAKQVGGNF